jgi:hypothetical protein
MVRLSTRIPTPIAISNGQPALSGSISDIILGVPVIILADVAAATEADRLTCINNDSDSLNVGSA